MAYGQHLKRNRCGTLCFRFVFPADVRPFVGRSEVSVSLGTASRKDAELARIELTAWVKRVVALARKSGAMDSNGKSPNNLLALLQHAQLKHLVSELTDAERDRDMEAKLRERARQERDSAVAAKNCAEEDRNHEKALREQVGEERDAALAEKSAAVAEATRVKDKLLERVMNEAPLVTSSPRISEAIAEYRTEKQTKESWSPKTAEMWRHRLGLVLNWFGDVPVATLTRAQFVEFVAALKRLPRNANKMAALKGMSMRELVESGYPPISESTVNQIMVRVAALWEWMTYSPERWHLKGNAAKDLLLDNVEVEEREPFTDDDFRKILALDEWQHRQFLHPYMYWTLPLAVLTGSRINEVAQLDLKDFKVSDGVNVISLCVVGKRKKNVQSRRTVPVHPLLIDLGLLRYVERLRAAGHQRLFPELKARRDGHGQDVSRWFGRLLDRAKITERTKVLHSARNTLVTAMYLAGVDSVQVNWMTGHRGRSESEETYFFKNGGFSVLAGHLAKASFPVLRELLPRVEDVTFGVSIHARKKKPPAQLGRRRAL